MNRQIRRPRCGADRPASPCCSSSSTWCRSCGPTTTTADPATTARSSGTSRRPRGSDPHRRRRGHRRERARRATGTDYQRVYPTGELFAPRDGLLLLHARHRAASSVSTTTSLSRPDRAAAAARACSDLFNDAGQHRRRHHSRCGPTSSRSPSRPSASARASVVAARPPHRRHPGHVEQPELRPEPHRRPRLRRGDRGPQDVLAPRPASRCWPTAYQERYLPGSTFKVVTTTAGLESGPSHAETVSSPRRASYLPPGTTDPIENYGGTTCGGDLVEVFRRSCNTAFAQMARRRRAPRPWSRTAEAFGFNHARRRSTCPGRRRVRLPVGRGLRATTSPSWPRRLRPGRHARPRRWRWRWWPRRWPTAA